MPKKTFEDPTIKAWQATIEPAPEGTKEVLVFKSEDDSVKKK